MFCTRIDINTRDAVCIKAQLHPDASTPMDSNQHHHSFTDHLSLYLPPFLRPSLPRDLRPSPLPQSRDPQRPPNAPPSTPEPSELRGRARISLDDEGVSSTNAISLNHEYQDSEEQRGRKLAKEKSIPQSESQAEEASAKSKEGYKIALILTNSGSVARDHLALERTFLAYVRTSLAMASTGVGERLENVDFIDMTMPR